MTQLWYCLKPEDCLKLIAYQDKHFPNDPLRPPGESRPITIKGMIEGLEEIDKLIRQPPASRKAVD